VEEYKHPEILYASGHSLELDLFYPQFKLAFEYQVLILKFAIINVLLGTTAF
jgi:hypothetical protein